MPFLDPVVRVLNKILSQLVSIGGKEDRIEKDLDTLVKIFGSPSISTIESLAVSVDQPTKQ